MSKEAKEYASIRKSPKGPGMFAATDSGEKPHRDLLAQALKVDPKAKVGGSKTLTR